PSTPVRESMPSLTTVNRSSVISGSISLTAPIIVVFPTPNPPLTMIFTGDGAGTPVPDSVAPPRSGDIGQPRLQAGPQSLQYLQVIGHPRSGQGDDQRTAVDQITEDDLGRLDRKAEPSGDLGDRARLVAAQLDRPGRLRTNPLDTCGFLRLQQGHQAHRMLRTGPTPGDRVGTHLFGVVGLPRRIPLDQEGRARHGCRVGAVWRMARFMTFWLGHDHRPPLVFRLTRIGVVRCSATLLTSRLISSPTTPGSASGSARTPSTLPTRPTPVSDTVATA